MIEGSSPAGVIRPLLAVVSNHVSGWIRVPAPAIFLVTALAVALALKLAGPGCRGDGVQG